MITLAAAKEHLAIDHDEHDARITALIETASDHLCSIGVNIDRDPLPAAIRHAALLLVGHFYMNAEAVVTRQSFALPLGVDRLIAPYREVSL